MNTPRSLARHQGGFTIIELMIATMVFSLVLLLCAIAIMQVGRMYYKGLTMSRTQGVSRAIIDEMSQAVQFGSGGNGGFFTTGSGTLPGPIPANAICIGTVRYSYVLHRQARDQIKHVFWKDRMGPADTCMPQNLTVDQPTATGEEMMGDHMRIASLSVTNPSGNLFAIDLTVSYGEAVLFTNNSDPLLPNYLSECKSDAGSQFCTVSSLNTRVVKRL